jgi:hypothetical protein
VSGRSRTTERRGRRTSISRIDGSPDRADYPGRVSARFATNSNTRSATIAIVIARSSALRFLLIDPPDQVKGD